MIYDGFVDHEVGVLHYLWPELAPARLSASHRNCNRRGA